MLPTSETMWAAFSFIVINSKNEGFFFFQMEFHTVNPPHFGGNEGDYLPGFSSVICTTLDLMLGLFMDL